MAVAQGYGKTVTSGSVFAYDTGDTVNSYRGEPTVNGVGNLNSFNPLDLYTWASSGNTSTWSRDTSSSLSPVKGIPLKEISSGTDSYSDTYNGSTDNIIAASSGQTWTVSVYALAAAGTNIQVWIFGANSSGNYIELASNGFTATGQWQRISVTMTFSNGSTAYVQSRVATSTNGGVIWWDGLQVEQKSYPTQFVNGTRSATQGLLPLVGNSTLDLSNVSFDSNAQMTFDGTNDYIALSPSNIPSTAITIELIYRNDNSGANTSVLAGGAGQQDLNIHLPWSDTNVYWDAGRPFNRINKATTNSERTGIHHWIFTKDSTTGIMNIYLDGSLWHTGTGLTSTIPTLWSVSLGCYDGGNGRSYYTTGIIPVVKIYNRALSAGEVRQNYLHYKTRFNLS